MQISKSYRFLSSALSAGSSHVKFDVDARARVSQKLKENCRVTEKTKQSDDNQQTQGVLGEVELIKARNVSQLNT